MMKITGLSHIFKWENLHNWWLTKYFFAPLYMFPFVKDTLANLSAISFPLIPTYPGTHTNCICLP